MDEEWECWESFNVCKPGEILWVPYTQRTHTWESTLTCVCCVEQPWKEILEMGHRERLEGTWAADPFLFSTHLDPFSTHLDFFYPLDFLPIWIFTVFLYDLL